MHCVSSILGYVQVNTANNPQVILLGSSTTNDYKTYWKNHIMKCQQSAAVIQTYMSTALPINETSPCSYLLGDSVIPEHSAYNLISKLGAF